jgi:putative glutamine amidotransferase
MTHSILILSAGHHSRFTGSEKHILFIQAFRYTLPNMERQMHRPVIGIIANHYLIENTYPAQVSGEMYMRAVSDVSDAVPIIIPAMSDIHDIGEILSVCHGILLTGGRPNVHPSHYGHEETEAHGPFDPSRDQIALDLSRACVERGVPLFGTCRGFQEIAVAFGGTLHPEIRDLPGRMNHRMPPEGTLEEKFAVRQKVELAAGSAIAELMETREIMVNTLHGQGVEDAAERIIIEGWAEDGTPEALRIDGARAFALAVQWHPESNAANDPVSRRLFSAFGDAARSHAGCGPRAY